MSIYSTSQWMTSCRNPGLIRKSGSPKQRWYTRDCTLPSDWQIGARPNRTEYGRTDVLGQGADGNYGSTSHKIWRDGLGVTGIEARYDGGNQDVSWSLLTLVGSGVILELHFTLGSVCR
jgi:hypothetical protein